MRKVYFFLALSGLIMASCVNDEYVGDNPDGTRTTGNEIGFGAGSNRLSRADITGADAFAKLGQFKVYGVKNLGSTYGTVFPNYLVDYNTGNSSQADYNEGWYYVGVPSTTQTIKYWDYSSADYHFVAGAPKDNYTWVTGTSGDIETATVTGLGGRLNHTTSVASTTGAVYVADPVVKAKANYNSEVLFTFRGLQSKVRVGVYETVPGYKITSISFYNNADTPASSQYITLNSATADYFQGASAGKATLTYDWTTPKYTFAYTADGLTKGKCWEGGVFANGVPATSSAAAIADLYGADNDMESTSGYFVVMPTPSTVAESPVALTLKCDYTLTSLDSSGEVINVKGATATIPATYTTWKENTAYTYLFKITDNTNGTTGNPDDTDPTARPEGLFPIVFDAVVENVEDGQVGTETTVATPSITCAQPSSVVTNGITFKAGEEIVVTVSVSSTITIQKLTGNFDYSKSYDNQAYDSSVSTQTATGTTATIAAPTVGTYVIKATTGTATSYFVLVVNAAEEGPANP